MSERHEADNALPWAKACLHDVEDGGEPMSYKVRSPPLKCED
jgi:hypothetical protein